MVDVNRESKNSRNFKILYAALLAVIVASAIFFLYSTEDTAYAIVNGEAITKESFFQSMYEQVGEEVLDELITQMLVYQEGNRLGLIVSAADVENEIDRIITENFRGSAEQFHLALSQAGISQSSLREEIRYNKTLFNIIEKQIEITDGEARNYFLSRQHLFDVPDQINVRHILVESEVEALNVVSLLENGASFSELAKNYSLDSLSKLNGGEYGFISPGEMPLEYDEIAFALEPGERSEPVHTWRGYYIIEVLERKAGREVTFDEAKEKVIDYIKKERAPDMAYDLVSTLWEKASIDYKKSE